MNSLVMYNPMTTIDVNVFVAAAVVLITSAISSLILLKQNAKFQKQIAALQESVNDIKAKLDAKPEVAVDETPELIVQEIVAPVVAQPVVPDRGNATDDEYIQILSRHPHRQNARSMLMRPANMTKEKYIKKLIELIKGVQWNIDNPDKVAKYRDDAKQRKADARAARLAALPVNRRIRAIRA